MFGREKIPLLEDKIGTLRQKSEKLKTAVRGLIKHGKNYESRIPAFFETRLKANQAEVGSIFPSEMAHYYSAWNTNGWENWQPTSIEIGNGASETGFVPGSIRVGDFVETRSNTGFALPAMLPFIGRNRTIVIKTGKGQYEKGLALLQSLLIRTALMLPHQTTYTLLDPAHLGQSFPMRTSLPQVQTNSQDVRRDLDQVIDRIVRLNTTFLEHQAFHEINLDVRINERYNLVFVADFPNKYDHRAIEALATITETGPRAGTYVFIHYNSEIELPRDVTMDIFKNALTIDLATPYTMTGMSLHIDDTPERSLQATVFRKLADSKPPERKIDFETEVGLPEDEWWHRSSDEIIGTTIGAVGATGKMEVWFGESDRGIVAHGVLGGATGSGKSNLYHVLISGLAMRFSPEELRFFLIDGKDGVEFQPYRKLPHAEVVSLKSSPQLSRSVLKELTLEQERRNEIFTRIGVANLTQYRRKGQPEGKLPRIVLLVDEYQELFEGDKDGQASAFLEQIARQGRSVGIHMLLGAQGFVGVQGMLNRTAIFGNIHLRMAMNMPATDVQALTEFQRQGKGLIMTCDLPGKIVVNHQSGNDGDSANQLGKVAYLTNEVRAEVINKLATKADVELDPKDNPVTIVFDGKAQPNFEENHLVEYLLQQDNWFSQDELQTVARREYHEEGFNVPDWFSAEMPVVMWLGQDFSVRGQAAMVFRRRVSENAMIVGSMNAARYGVLGASLTSIALNKDPKDVQFIIVDRSIPGTDWSETLNKIVKNVLVPAGFTASLYRENRDVERVLDDVLKILNDRKAMNESDLIYEPEVFCVFTELDRVDDLRRPAGSYMSSESPLGDKLNRIYQEGPSLGIHSIMSFSNVRPMTHVVDERHGLTHFRHRIALQMSEDESLTLVRSRRAAALQNEGPLPIVGLYMDTDNDSNIRFKPYSIEATINYDEQMTRIGQRLAERGKTS